MQSVEPQVDDVYLYRGTDGVRKPVRILDVAGDPPGRRFVRVQGQLSQFWFVRSCWLELGAFATRVEARMGAARTFLGWWYGVRREKRPVGAAQVDTLPGEAR